MSNESEAGPLGELGDIADEVGGGLGEAAEGMPEDSPDREGMETAANVTSAVGEILGGAQAAGDATGHLRDAIAAGDEAGIASQTGNMLGGLGAAAGGAADALAHAVPEEARHAMQTVGTVARTVGRIASAAERVVGAVQSIAQAVEGRRLTFRTSATLGARLVAHRAVGTWPLSGLYAIKVRVVCGAEGGLDDEALDALMMHSARIKLTHGAGDDDSVHGIVRRVEMLAVGAEARSVHYELTLAPKLWRFTLVRRSRVFPGRTGQGPMSHLDVIKAVLHDHGFDEGTRYVDETEEEYPAFDQVTQHEESDFDFLSRLMQHNGIHYHFRHDPRGEVLVLGDRNAHFQPIDEALRYYPHESPPDDNAPVVRGWRRVILPRPHAIRMREFSEATPQTPLDVDRPVDERTGRGTTWLFGEHFRDDAEGQRLVRVRAEELMTGREVFSGTTTFRDVQPGRVFELTGHPIDALNQRYLVTECTMRMNDGYHYECDFKAIPFTTPYRPARTVRWPRVEGVVPAIVDGAQHATATPVDAEGRYRLVFPYDQVTTAGGQASRWVRRVQPSAGAGYGMHLPLHVGTEVAVAHVRGDPDRPVILGAVPNAATESPITQASATQSRIRTGSGVTIELDDDC